MNGQTALQSDLLPRGMSKTTRILGVPFSYALGNIGLFVFVMMAGYAASGSFMAFVIALGGMSLCHLVMMLLSFHDDKALAMLVSNATRCPKNGDVNQYTPFEQVKKGVSLIKEYPVSRHIPFSHLFNAHTVVSKKGELFQVIELNGFVASTRENDVIDAFKSVKNRLLYQMATPELAVQFYFIKRKAVFLPKGEYYNDYAVAFNARLLGSLQQTPLNQNRLFIVITHKAPKFAKNSANVNFYGRARKELDDASARMLSLFKDNDASLLSAHPREYSPLLSFLSELINLDTRAVKTPLQDLSQALPFSKPAFAKNKGVGQITYPNGSSRFFAMLSLKEYPDDTHACLMDTLIEAPEELMLTQSFTFKHAQYAIHELDKQQRKMRQTDDSITLSDELSLAQEELKANRAAFGEHSLSLCVMADSEDALNKSVHAIESRLNQRAGLVTLKETQGLELAFWAQLPCNGAYRIRTTLMSSLNMAGFASLHNEARGQEYGNHWGDALALLETQSKTPYWFNFHVGQVGNSVFLGPMGSGKTLLLGFLLAQSMKYGGRRYIFDKDRGLEVLVRALGGSYHVIEPGTPSGMAPLQLADTSENRAFNILLLNKILSIHGTLKASDEKKIERAIDGIYSLDKPLRTFRNLAPFLGAATQDSLRERFDRWHSQGQHAWLFDNEIDSLDMSHSICGQDIGKFLNPENADLTTPALLYIFHRLRAYLDSSPTAVFIPEGWKVVRDPVFKDQILDWSKTPRKFNMALILDSQNPKELSASPEGLALVDEAVTQVFFANPKASPKDYARFNLTAREIEIIRHELPARDGHYFLLKQGKISTVVRLNLTGLESDVHVLSGNHASSKLLDALFAKYGTAIDDWFPHFVRLKPILKNEFNDDFMKFNAQRGVG